LVKLSAVWRTLTITKNPYAGLSLKWSQNRKAITFKNGHTYRLTWPQFRYLRDSYQLFSEYTLSQIDDNLFKIEKKTGAIICSGQLLPLIGYLMQDFDIQQQKPELYHLKKDKVELFGSSDMLVCLQELRTCEYECDCKDKVVLDVGGFEGESAAYFWSKGAKKIVIYEPLAEHVEFIKQNVSLNKIKADIHQMGIGKEDGTITIHYDRISPGFGFHSRGNNRIEIKIRDVSKVIEESDAEIAKFDCESAEDCLVDVPAKILQKIPYYIIEVHSTNIRKRILGKFQGAGFALEKEVKKQDNFSVLKLRKIN
jgi:FkbM family methyltransferase